MKKKTKGSKKSATQIWARTTRFVGRHKVLRGFLWFLLGTTVVILILMLAFKPLRNSQFERLGASYSIKYAEELGIDWQDGYMALLEDIDIQALRLMSYWDIYEVENDVYNFETLDWQMDKAYENGAKVSLAVGLRQPRWPECHQPTWADDLSRDDRNAELEEFITILIKRYKNHPALESYQLENEALNHWFGVCHVHDRGLIRDRLINEFNLIKSLDPEHPVIMSLSDQHGLPTGEPTPDVFGYSIYRIVYNSQLFPGYLLYPTPVWYHRIRAQIIDWIKDRPIIIHELQLEPWGPDPTVDLSIDEQNRSMSPKQMYRNVDFARQIGLDEAYLWGAEWWYWRMTEKNDPIIWETAKDIINQVNTGQDFQKKL